MLHPFLFACYHLLYELARFYLKHLGVHGLRLVLLRTLGIELVTFEAAQSIGLSHVCKYILHPLHVPQPLHSLGP